MSVRITNGVAFALFNSIFSMKIWRNLCQTTTYGVPGSPAVKICATQYVVVQALSLDVRGTVVTGIYLFVLGFVVGALHCCVRYLKSGNMEMKFTDQQIRCLYGR